MSFVFELIFELVFGLAIEFVGEIFVEWGFHSTAERLSVGKRNVGVLALAYAVFGAVLGWLSIFVAAPAVIEMGAGAAMYFVLSPILAELMLTAVSWLINRGIRPVKFFETKKFAFGVVFGAAFTLMRALIN
jgi:hypothetical protein